MYKIINQPGIVSNFEGTSISEVTTREGISKKLPVTIRVDGDLKSGLSMADIDAFNVLDIFVVSDEVYKVISSASGEVIPRSTFVFFKGDKLEKKYYTLFLGDSVPIGTLTANDVDWLPDANHPIKSSYVCPVDIALDKELKFPVISSSLKDKIESEGLLVNFRKYPEL